MKIRITNLDKFLRKMPRQTRRAMGVFVNNQVWLMKQEAIPKTLKEEFTIRAEKFVMSSIRFQKAKLGGYPPYIARVGTVEKRRFSGLAEQEGANPEFDHTLMKLARNNAWIKKALGSRRVKPANQFPSAVKMVGYGGRRGNAIMLRKLNRENYRKPFIVAGHPKLKKGLYMLKGRKNKYGFAPIRKIQDFTKVTRPKRVGWAIKSVHMLNRLTSPDREFKRALLFVFGRK